jgi:hypothetical protein
MDTKRWLATNERFFKVTLHNKLSLTCGSVHGFYCSNIGQKVWPELFSLSLLHVSPVIIKWVRGSFLLTNSRLRCFGFRIHWFWIRIQIKHFRLNTDPDPGFWWPKTEKICIWKKWIFFGSKIAVNLSLGLQRGLQATEEAFSSQKRTYSTSKHEICLTIVGKFCPPGSGYGSTDLRESGSNPDLDPKHWPPSSVMKYTEERANKGQELTVNTPA